MVKGVVGVADAFPDGFGAGGGEHLADDDSREAREAGVTAAERWHSRDGKDIAEAWVAARERADRAVEVRLRVEIRRGASPRH
jgi:hypothetical protein